jgi:WD40 repeat protein
MPIELEKIDRTSFPMGVMDLAVQRDGRAAFVGCMDGIYRCEFPTEDSPQDQVPLPICIGRHGSYVSGVALHQSKSSLISASYDGTIQIRNLAGDDTHANELKLGEGVQSVDGNEIAPWLSERVHGFWSWKMALSPDERWIASVTGQYLAGGEDYAPLPSPEPTVKVFESDTGRLVHAFDMLPSVQCVAFDSKSQHLAAGNLMGDLAVWNVISGEQRAQWRTPSFTSWGIIKSHCFIGGIHAIAFSPDNSSLYAAGMGEMRDPMAGDGKQRWQRFDWQKTPVEKIQESAADQTGEGLMESLVFAPDGQHFVMAGRLRGGNWNVAIFATESGQLVGQAKTGMRITATQFSHDGQILYLAGMQGQPELKDNQFPSFGYLERYRVKTTG